MVQHFSFLLLTLFSFFLFSSFLYFFVRERRMKRKRWRERERENASPIFSKVFSAANSFSKPIIIVSHHNHHFFLRMIILNFIPFLSLLFSSTLKNFLPSILFISLPQYFSFLFSSFLLFIRTNEWQFISQGAKNVWRFLYNERETVEREKERRVREGEKENKREKKESLCNSSLSKLLSSHSFNSRNWFLFGYNHPTFGLKAKFKFDHQVVFLDENGVRRVSERGDEKQLQKWICFGITRERERVSEREREREREKERERKRERRENWWRQNLGTITELKSKVIEEKQVRKGDKKSRVRKDEGWEKDWVRATERERERKRWNDKKGEWKMKREREREDEKDDETLGPGFICSSISGW